MTKNGLKRTEPAAPSDQAYMTHQQYLEWKRAHPDMARKIDEIIDEAVVRILAAEARHLRDQAVQR